MPAFLEKNKSRTLKNEYKLQIKQNVSEIEELLKPFERPLHDKALLIPVLVNQLREVIQQTEVAALDIGGRFMNISRTGKKSGFAGRRRLQRVIRRREKRQRISPQAEQE